MNASKIFCFTNAIVFAVAITTASRLIMAADRPPNIVFMIADDLGYGDLGCYGQQRIKTPQLDRMAKEGLRFTNFYAGSTVCAPSRCVLMTGYHTGHAFIRGNSKQDLRPEDITLAAVMKASGYATGIVGKWGLGHEGTTGVPTRQGFDSFFGYLDQHHAHNFYPAFLMKNEQRFPLKNVVPGNGPFGSGVATAKVDYSHDLITDEALAFIDHHHHEPFFLYLAWTTPHANNEAKQKGMEVPDFGIYANENWPEPQKGHAAMISRMDRDVGRVIERLQKHGIDDNTLILFTSDNGPHREGGNDPDFNDSNGPLRGIKRELTDGGIRVPMLARWPGKIAAGKETDFVGGFQDVMPTLADIANRDRPSNTKSKTIIPSDIDGLSFEPTLRGRSDQKQHEFLYWAFYEGGAGQAVRFGPWKLVQQPIHSAPRLYNVVTDIGEQHDVADLHAEIVATGQKHMASAYVPSETWKFPEAKDTGKKKR